MKRFVCALCFLGAAGTSACGGSQSKSAVPPASASPSPSPPASASASPSPSASPPPPAAVAGKPCGDQHCLAFDTPAQAFESVLSEQPEVLAVGEAHAQKGAPAVRSATRRFAEELLPRLEGRASDIVLELLVASGRCGKEREKAVAERQKPATESQADSNQNQFVTLGTFAKKIHVSPHALEPTCDEYQAVLDAGGEDIARLLGLIRDVTVRTVDGLLDDKNRNPKAMVVTYGGALHNDVAPPPDRAAWSFGPHFSEKSQGHYVELDLIVPEYIKDTESWRSLPWYSSYDRQKLGSSSVLFNPAPHSYVLIFPVTATVSGTVSGSGTGTGTGTVSGNVSGSGAASASAPNP